MKQGLELNNLPGPATRNTQAVKNINSDMKKVDEEEDHITEGAVIPEKYNNRRRIEHELNDQQHTVYWVRSNKNQSCQ